MKHKRLFYNTLSSILYQVITLICTFILPRQILLYYGSDVNGLISSISQFLGFIALMEMGIGAVVQSALYKPLVNDDSLSINKIMTSAQRFFNKLALVLAGYIICLCLVYPVITHSVFSTGFIIPLILALSINLFAQYYFGITRQLLLGADQRTYIHLTISGIVLIVNTAVGIFLIHCHHSIQLVQWIMALVLLIRPIGIYLFTQKYYHVRTNIVLTEEPIKQKWNGIAQHISAFLLSHTDVVLLTLFSSLQNISIYSVYYMVVAGIRRFITTSMTGVFSWFGQLYVAKDPSLMYKFSFYEWLLHTGSTLVFTVAGILIVPFVLVYTQGIHDANYNQPLFGALLLAAYAMFTIRLPYLTMILAAGHYKETQHISFLEAGLNVLISLIGVQFWGLCGVALGTLISMTFCTCYFAYYLRSAILSRPLKYFVSHCIVNLVTALIIIISTYQLIHKVENYYHWTLMAVTITLIALLETTFINYLFYRKMLYALIDKIRYLYSNLQNKFLYTRRS